MKRTKTRLLSTALSLVVICAGCIACQSTPDQDYVIYKETEDIYGEAAAVSLPSEEIHKSLEWEWNEIVYQDSYNGADADVRVSIDIKGRYLESGVPVLRVSHHEFTPDELRSMALAVMPQDEYYDPVSSVSDNTLRQWKKAAQEDLERALESRSENKSIIVENLRNEIRIYDDLLADKNREKMIPSDWQTNSAEDYYINTLFADEEEQEGYSSLYIQTKENDQGLFDMMHISTYTGDDFRWNELEYQKCNGYLFRGIATGTWIPTEDVNKLSDEDELAQVEAALSRYGLGYLRPVSYTHEGSGIVFWFSPSYMGLDYITVQKESEYAENHMPERVYAVVFEDRICQIKIMNAVDTAVESESLQLISKEEALEQLKLYMQTIYTWRRVVGEDNYNNPLFQNAYKDCEVLLELSELRFGYVRIPVKNDPTEFRLVPAWAFCGNKFIDHDGRLIRLGIDSDSVSLHPETLMVINAIDGSYIEHYDGYMR